MTDKLLARKKRARERGLAAVRDRRRFKNSPVPTGTSKIAVPGDASGTLFPSRVSEPLPGVSVLKDGASNSKIGGDVLVGWMRGARIVTLTLEERASCPRSCDLWTTCYGNAMPHPHRWKHGPELLERLEVEVRDLCAAHERVLVRLHILGDFWSHEAVDFWDRSLRRHKNLYVFGFTAHRRGTPIGDWIADVRRFHPGRFFIRHSGTTGQWGSFTIDFPTEKCRLGDAVVCPEQQDAMRGGEDGIHCGSCGLCWKSDVPIVFIEH